MTYVFIADLHLSPNHPRLTRGFLALLQHYADANTQLYILGDWFNAWIGDDVCEPWIEELAEALQMFSNQGNQIYFLVGNRDFALGQAFLDRFDGKLLVEVSHLLIAKHRIRIEHGDVLCTDDVSYQRFRKIIRSPLILHFLKKTPLKFRAALAQGFRRKSQKAQEFKSFEIMDVNALAVEHALTDVDLLIHGHTHRPQVHQYDQKYRIVLGDWREQAGEAKILEINDLGIWKLLTWRF